MMVIETMSKLSLFRSRRYEQNEVCYYVMESYSSSQKVYHFVPIPNHGFFAQCLHRWLSPHVSHLGLRAMQV